MENLEKFIQDNIIKLGFGKKLIIIYDPNNKTYPWGICIKSDHEIESIPKISCNGTSISDGVKRLFAAYDAAWAVLTAKE